MEEGYLGPQMQEDMETFCVHRIFRGKLPLILNRKSQIDNPL